VPVTLADLAGRSDRELLAAFGDASAAEAGARLAWARVAAPYLEPAQGADLARTRQLLREAMELLETGRAAEADGRVLDAYLQGFEQAEPRLRARDAAATRAVESAFHGLRAELSRGDVERARTRARQLDAQLVALLSDTRPLLPFVAAAVIYLREGLEAALLIGALLAGVARVGRPAAARYIHAGWLLAIPAGLATFWVLVLLLDLGAARRELMEAGVALLAAAVLFCVSFWMISKAESQRWTAYLKERVDAGLNSRNLWLLTGLSFLAAYREVAETALFTQALLLDAPGRSVEVWGGAAAGLLGVTAIAFGLSRSVMRLPLAPFFAVSSLLLLGLAMSFAGSGLYELVTAGYLRPRPVAWPSLPWLGIHPDLTVLLVQLSIVSVVGLAGLATLRRSLVPARNRDDARERG
jgi:high-affinity iron transporter